MTMRPWPDEAPMTAPISCYIRTKNEQRCIGTVIAAVRDYVAEVIVVDSGSTDLTVEIAAEYGAHVIRQDWLGRGKQKRFAEDNCRHDFVLDLDADEVVSMELGLEIARLFENALRPAYDVYSVPIVTVRPDCREEPRFKYPRRNKLYNRRVIRQPDHVGWDQFVANGQTIGRLEGVLWHYSYADLGHALEKLNDATTERAATYSEKRSLVALRLRVLFALPWYFFKQLVLRGLFLGGVYGYAVAGISAYGLWLRDAKAYERKLFDEKRQ